MARFLRADDLKRHVRTVHSKDVDNHLYVTTTIAIHTCSPSHSTHLATSSIPIQKSNPRASAALQMSQNLNEHADISLTQLQFPITVEPCPMLLQITTLRSLLKRSLRRFLPMARAKGMGPMAR
jgi:hypothetical protein